MNRISEFFRSFFQQHLRATDMVCAGGFAAGILLSVMDVPAGKALMIVFAVALSFYHLLLFSYSSKYDDQKTSLERSATLLIGITITLLVNGIALKMAGYLEKDKLLNIGLVCSILISAIILLYYLLKSEQLSIRNVPFLRNLLFGFGALIVFLMPLKTERPARAFPVNQGSTTEQVLAPADENEPLSSDSTAAPAESETINPQTDTLHP